MARYSYESEHSEGAMGDTFLNTLTKKVRDTFDLNRVQLEDFEGFYPDNKLAADAEYVEVRKKGFANYGPEFSAQEIARMEKSKKMSDLMEAIIIDPKVIRSWYGQLKADGTKSLEVNSMGTSELDDYANGVDVVWELKQEQEGVTHLALGVDVTYSSSFEDKLKFIKGDILAGTLANVEYFLPRWGDMQGRILQIPRAVVGVDATRLSQLAVYWARLDERMDDMANDPSQLIILEEIMMQLPVYESYANQIGQVAVAEKISNSLKRFERLYNMTKTKLNIPKDIIMEDKVLQTLQEYLRNFQDLPVKHSTGKLREDINRKHGVK